MNSTGIHWTRVGRECQNGNQESLPLFNVCHDTDAPVASIFIKETLPLIFVLAKHYGKYLGGINSLNP